MKTRSLLVSCLLVFGAVGRLSAGTVITTNLPSNTRIVNINAQQDGASSYNGGQSGQALWYSPFGTGPNGLLALAVLPGTYTFRIVNPTDAQLAFPSLTTTQLNSIYTAWTFNTPWITQYFVFDIAAATNANLPQLFDGAGGATTFGDAQSAYNAAVSGGYANRLRLTSEQPAAQPGREGNVFEFSYTVATATSLVFVVPDNGLSDNTGGISVVVTQVPEPGTVACCSLAGGLLAAGWLRRRHRASV